LDLSVTNVCCKTIFVKNRLPNLKRFYIDFCPKIEFQLLLETLSDFCPRMTYVSLFGTLKLECSDLLKRKLKMLKTVVAADQSTGEQEMRDFAKLRGLTLSNWLITQQRMVKANQPMLSQIFLQSFQDL